MRCCWSVRRLKRWIGSRFYERTAPSRNKATLPEERELVLEIERTQAVLEERGAELPGGEDLRSFRLRDDSG